MLVCAGFLTSAVAQRRKAHKLRATAVVEVTTDSSGKVDHANSFPLPFWMKASSRTPASIRQRHGPWRWITALCMKRRPSAIPVGTATILSGANSNGWTALGKWQIVTAAAKKSEAPPRRLPRMIDQPSIARAGSGSSSSTPTSSTPASSNPAPSSTPHQVRLHPAALTTDRLCTVPLRAHRLHLRQLQARPRQRLCSAQHSCSIRRQPEHGRQ